MHSVWLFLGLVAFLIVAYFSFEFLLKKLSRPGFTQALVASASRKAFDKVHRRRAAQRKKLLARAELLERILQANPHETSVRKDLIKLYCAELMVEPLKQHTLAMLAQNPSDDLACTTAFALARENDFFFKAREIFQSAADKVPDRPLILQCYINFLLGRVNYVSDAERSSILEETQTLVARLLSLAPRDPNALWLHAMVLQHQGNLERAAEQLSAASPQPPQMLLQLGEILTRLGKVPEAQDTYRRAIDAEFQSIGKAGPVANVAHNKLGIIALRADDKESALAHLRQAIPTASHISFYRNGLDLDLAAELVGRNIAPDEVLQYLDIALAYAPDSSIACELRARLEKSSYGRPAAGG